MNHAVWCGRSGLLVSDMQTRHHERIVRYGVCQSFLGPQEWEHTNPNAFDGVVCSISTVKHERAHDLVPVLVLSDFTIQEPVVVIQVDPYLGDPTFLVVLVWKFLEEQSGYVDHLVRVGVFQIVVTDSLLLTFPVFGVSSELIGSTQYRFTHCLYVPTYFAGYIRVVDVLEQLRRSKHFPDHSLGPPIHVGWFVVGKQDTVVLFGVSNPVIIPFPQHRTGTIQDHVVLAQLNAVIQTRVLPLDLVKFFCQDLAPLIVLVRVA